MTAELCKTVERCRPIFRDPPKSRSHLRWIGFAVGFIILGFPQSRGQDIGATAELKTEITSKIEAAIAEGDLAGAVVCFADAEKILFLETFGDRQVEPTVEAMEADTIFDLASITKPVATASSIMLLQQQGKLDLDQKVVEHLPEFSPHGKDEITIKQLLLHVGGLIPDNALADYQEGNDVAWQKICDLKLRSPPGEKFSYTDVGFIVLGKLVEKLSGQTLDRFAREQIFEPLGMNETMYNLKPSLRGRCAPTEKRDGEMIRGVVHDPRAFAMGGVAGHAGLFSSAGDLVKYGQALLGENARSHPVFHQETIELMATPTQIPRGTRAMGWDHQSPYSRNRGTSLSDRAFGHGGFTGTVLWIDPKKQRVFVFLSSRLHPDGKGSVNTLAGEIVTMLAEQL